MKLTTKQMISIIGEQLARIIELNGYLDAAESAFNRLSEASDVKRKKR